MACYMNILPLERNINHNIYHTNIPYHINCKCASRRANSRALRSLTQDQEFMNQPFLGMWSDGVSITINQSCDRWPLLSVSWLPVWRLQDEIIMMSIPNNENKSCPIISWWGLKHHGEEGQSSKKIVFFFWILTNKRLMAASLNKSKGRNFLHPIY